MNPAPSLARLDWLRLSRGPAYFFLPAAWVRRVSSIPAPQLLPLAEAWVLGLAPADAGRWLPVMDPLTAAGADAPRRGVAALLAAPHGDALAWFLTDEPGELAALPAGAGEPHPALPWLRRAPPAADGRDCWIWDAAEWAATSFPA